MAKAKQTRAERMAELRREHGEGRTLTHREKAEALRDRGALFVISHSGGKDSQAMYLAIRKLVPAHQIICIYARMPDDIVWKENLEHIRRTVCVPVHTAHAVDKEGALKGFWDYVAKRERFPGLSNMARWCTSDFKTGPIQKVIRHHIKDHGLSGLVVECLGIRAEESDGRANSPSWVFDEHNSKAGREWYRWVPVHHWTAREVFAEIAEAGQKPHWVYQAGMRRNSCCFCIYATPADARTAAILRPQLFQRYVEEEKRLNFSLSMPKDVRVAGSDGKTRTKKVKLFLEDYAGITVAEAIAANARVRKGVESAGVPCNLENPYGDPDQPETEQPCDDVLVA